MAKVPDLLKSGVRTSKRLGREAGRRLERIPPRVEFPWYDSIWLSSYLQARTFLEQHRPDKLGEFENALSVFRTNPDFDVTVLDDLFDADVFTRIRETIAGYRVEQLEPHELLRFGRFVVHDDPYFLELQRSVVERISDVVGEPLETSYNFLSLYQGDASCPVHMDAPSAKWTLDICIDQSRKWPIEISKVEPWPETWAEPESGDWQTSIRTSRPFRSYEMEPGQALVFGGSGQWHVRDQMVDATRDDYCTLLFFHFVPRGAAHLARPENWAEIFDVPELAPLTQ